MIMVMNNIVAATVFHFKQSRYCKTKRHQMIADQIFLTNIWWERDFCRCDIIGDLHSKSILVDGQKVRIGDDLVRLALSYNYISFSFRIVFVFCEVGDITW